MPEVRTDEVLEISGLAEEGTNIITVSMIFWDNLIRSSRLLVCISRLQDCLKPRVKQDLRSSESFRRLPPQEAADEAAGFGGDVVRNTELSTPDFGKQSARVRVMEGIASHQQGIEHHSQTPHIGRFSRVSSCRVQDLRTDVCGAAVLV